ncbi:MAG: ParB/RepB/Spo0J family partition protein [Clostridia bacterium]|nr:ParB/RepB/Spo0J family partition protein [Clostridia bacterium]
MAKQKGGLGRGFDALFADNTAGELSDENKIVLVPIGDIEPDRTQPRRRFDEARLAELAESIREHGVIQPLIVTPSAGGGYRIVAGERRFRAARMAGLRELPVIVRAFSEEETAVIALIENLQREDLNAIEAAQGISRLIDVYGFTQEQAADKLGKSRSAVTNTLRLMNLPEEVRELVAEDKLSAGHARALLGIRENSRIADAAREVIDGGLSVRETEKLVKRYNEAPKVPVRKKRDPFFDEAELAAKAALGRKVVVKNRARGGVIEIEYFDKEDLSRLIKALED